MKAIQIAEPGRLERIEREDPGPPGPGEVLVRSHSMGICGTDVSSYLGKFPFFDYPRIPGHELGVEVVEVGPEVEGIEVGDRCSVEPYMNCGNCYACRKGATNCCENLDVIGVMSDGGLCDRFLVRADKLHVSSRLTFDQLALVETLAIGCHAVARSGADRHDRVLIIGAGPIGLSALEFIRPTGASLAVMDIETSRLDFCENRYGIEDRIEFSGDGSEMDRVLELTDGDRYPVVIDATGNHHSMSGALGFVAPTGTLVYLGVTREHLSFPHPALHRPEITIRGSRNALPEDFRTCIGALESGRIDAAAWITRRMEFGEVVEGFGEVAASGENIKVVVEVGGE